MGKFLIKKTKTGYSFVLKANNGEIIATSEVYSSESGCISGTESVRKNAPIAKIEDLTEGNAKVTNPKFEIYLDKTGDHRFRLKARNGEIIASSESYKSKKSCENGIESVKQNAPDSKVEKDF
jgi:uncharacterized protein